MSLMSKIGRLEKQNKELKEENETLGVRWEQLKQWVAHVHRATNLKDVEYRVAMENVLSKMNELDGEEF